jgi:hypothetical protein
MVHDLRDADAGKPIDPDNAADEICGVRPFDAVGRRQGQIRRKHDAGASALHGIDKDRTSLDGNVGRTGVANQG